MPDQEPIEGDVLVTEPDKFEIVGKIAKYVAGYGAGVIVGQIIDTNVAPKNVVQKVGIYVGAAALCGLAAHHAGNYAKEYTEEFVDSCRRVSKIMSDLQEEIRKIKEQNV
jgi:hypothetical protein